MTKPKLKSEELYPITHRAPEDVSDRVALGTVKVLRFVADRVFAGRYGHRAVVLETVAAVPGMVGGLLQHLKALRHIRDDQGWIRELLEEADNERMHLMTFVQVAQPSTFERGIIMLTQAIFYNFYFFLYLFAPKTAHRMVAYFEEEAVISYTNYLADIDAGRHPNPPAPAIAIEYWNLSPSATLRDVVVAVRADEAGHRDRNHEFADHLLGPTGPNDRGAGGDTSGEDVDFESVRQQSPDRDAA
ncbi:MAG: alternative oxidase [Alphaproteobacteria bacterium]|nr:alternative oxidase [Alphaproteobacteria bacterium]